MVAASASLTRLAGAPAAIAAQRRCCYGHGTRVELTGRHNGRRERPRHRLQGTIDDAVVGPLAPLLAAPRQAPTNSFMWCDTVAWDRATASVWSQMQASPPSVAEISDDSRTRVGSPERLEEVRSLLDHLDADD
jgi:hypothetical protein